MTSLELFERDSYDLVLAPGGPCWTATNREGAQLLEDLASAAGSVEHLAADLAARDGLTDHQALEVVSACAAETRPLLEAARNGQYAGRMAYLSPTHLRELWVHINNRCNFSCRHCLVSSGPRRGDGLPPDTLRGVIDQARDLGCLTFFFTGGEPLLRNDLPDLLRDILGDPEAHAVVLTNGSLIDDAFIDALGDADLSRLHLQISLDGSTPALNDQLRSPDAFDRATAGIRRAVAADIDVSVATVVLAANLDDLPAMPGLLRQLGVRSWHLMWAHRRERGADEPMASVDEITEAVLAIRPVAERAGVRIDNFENFRAIVNGEPNTRHDGTNACWDSLAIYADGGIYPSAALVGVDEFRGGDIHADTLREAWLDSPVFEDYRHRTSLPEGAVERDPFALLHGGGDPEHAFFFSGDIAGPDPYLPLYRAMMLDLMDEIATDRTRRLTRREDVPVIYHLMGQDGLACPVNAGVSNSGPHRIDFVHSNCVLMQDVVGHAREIVQGYYGEAAVESKGEICCPVPVDRRALAHVPERVLKRSYGCGSPVFAADVREGESIIDLGSGGGIECFAASKMVGPEGRVIGVDMTPEMLELAESARPEVAEALGYDNVRFIRGYLEAVPVADNTADLVISNCVINLSPNKLVVFDEIRRVLKPGGRMVISDISAVGDVPEQVRFNPRLKSECLGGALERDELLFMLTKLGFEDVQTEYEMPWRTVEGAEFCADTVVARKPVQPGRRLPYVGIRHATKQTPEQGHAECHRADCMVCGASLQYLQTAVAAECEMCGRELRTRSRCAEGHFVCDQCHGGDYLRFVREWLAQCSETDPVTVFLSMRDAYPFPVHGPEHHALVPAALLIAYHNLHGCPDHESIWEAVEEGAELPGGSCAYWGACAAALGVGVAYNRILGATPLSSTERGAVQRVVSRILDRIAELDAPRCCRREVLLSLQTACELSGELLPEAIHTSDPARCDQMWANHECIQADCPFAPGTAEVAGVTDEKDHREPAS